MQNNMDNPLEKFSLLGLTEKTLGAVAKKGYDTPSPIQEKAIPILLNGEKDVLGQAQTGTGKTAAFALPIIECITPGAGHVQAIVLTPTRELAIQLAKDFDDFSIDTQASVFAVYGGQSIDIQIKKLRKGVDIIVGTPGRVIDLMNRRELDLSKISFAVLDEADVMLNMGFVEDIEQILEGTPHDKRMLLFSATMPDEIMRIAETFMREYEVVNVKTEATNSDLTEQVYYEIKRTEKLDALLRLLDYEMDIYGIIFCRTRDDADELYERMRSKNIKAEVLHGDINQSQRIKVIEGFKTKKFKLLIATDVAARGIDINTLTHVINYSIPENSEIYIHRIGRTGRAGKSGKAITFVTPGEVRRMNQIKRDIKVDIRKSLLPSPKEIVAKRFETLSDTIKNIAEKNHHKCYMHFAEKLLDETAPDMLVAAMLRYFCKNELQTESYRELDEEKPKKKNDRLPKKSKNYVKLFFNCGKDDGFGAKKILDLIYNRTKIKGYYIGKVDCYDRFTYVEVSESDAEFIIQRFKEKGGKGKRINVEYAREEK